MAMTILTNFHLYLYLFLPPWFMDRENHWKCGWPLIFFYHFDNKKFKFLFSKFFISLNIKKFIFSFHLLAINYCMHIIDSSLNIRRFFTANFSRNSKKTFIFSALSHFIPCWLNLISIVDFVLMMAHNYAYRLLTNFCRLHSWENQDELYKKRKVYNFFNLNESFLFSTNLFSLILQSFDVLLPSLEVL